MWGGCISCPQFFIFPGAQKSCCTETGQCERPTKSAPAEECQRISLELQNAIHLHLDLPPAITSWDLPAPVAVSRALPRSEGPAVEPSPPDLNISHLDSCRRSLARRTCASASVETLYCKEIQTRKVITALLLPALSGWLLSPLANASGHGPVFGLATPTNPKRRIQLRYELHGPRRRGFMFRPPIGFFSDYLLGALLMRFAE